MILHATCKIMGKLKQLLPQAAPSLCQNTTESLRGKGKTALVKAAKIVWWLLCGRLQPGLSDDSNHCGMVFVLFLLFSHFKGEEGVSGSSDASLELGWSTSRFLPCQWLPCVSCSHPSPFCPSLFKEERASISLRCVRLIPVRNSATVWESYQALKWFGLHYLLTIGNGQQRRSFRALSVANFQMQSSVWPELHRELILCYKSV